MSVNLDVLTLGERYTRPELAELWGYQGYQAIARGVVTPTRSGLILLFVTHIKQESFVQYKDFISGDYLYWEGEEGHANDERIARAHEQGEEVYLFYRDIHHSPFEYRGPLELLRFIRHDDRPSEFTFRVVHDLGADDDIALHEGELKQLKETEREAVVKARIGQGDFRDRLLKLWQSCAVTGVSETSLLRAGHIKPWRSCTNSERLDPFNGLLLLPQYDHLFDRGLITFADNGNIIPSPVIEFIPATTIGLDLSLKLRKLEPSHRPFFEFHRQKVFVEQRTSE